MTTTPPPRDDRVPAWRALEPQVLTDDRLLGERLVQLVWVRLLLALAIVGGALIGRHVLGIPGLDVETLVGTGFAMVAWDLVAWRVGAHFRGRTGEPDALRVVRWVTYGAIVLDYLALTVVVWQVGGARSPFLAFFLLHAIVSGVMLGKRPALALHGVACALVVAIVVADWSGLAPPPPVPPGPGDAPGHLDTSHAAAIVLAYVLLFALTGFILTSFSSNLRRAEKSLREANAELTRLSEMRRDFLEIALHNLQSPIGAARMHIANLLAGLGGPVTPEQRQWLTRANERLEGLTGFMRSLSALSALESVRIEERAAPADLAPVLADIVREQQDAAQQRRITLVLEPPAGPLPVLGVEVLLREAIVNYVTNALKYTPEGGHVVVRGASDGATVRVEVTDDGPGIPEADRPKLFREFVRLREKGRPVPKVAGSGLGLTIVARVAKLHGGRVGVEGAPGHGSTFFAEFPRHAA